MPLSSERALGAAETSFQNVRAVSLLAFSAAPWMLSRVRVRFAPRGAAGSARLPAAG